MGRNHSATTFTKKLAVISGCRATVAGKSPVVLIGSTVMFFGLTSTLEESAMAIFSAEMPPNSLPDSETLAAISTVEPSMISLAATASSRSSGQGRRYPRGRRRR